MDQTSFPRQDERFPLTFDARKQAFFRQFHIRTLDDFSDPMVDPSKGDESFAQRTQRPLHDMLQMLEQLLDIHQMTWRPSSKNEMLLYFPFMFVVPQVGWQLRNRTTMDIYTVKQVTLDHKKQFTGAVLFTGGLAPPGRGTAEHPGRWDRLEWVTPYGKVIDFHISWPEKEIVESQPPPDSADEGAAAGTGFPPTITSLLTREEPGTIDKREFGPAKMAKPKVMGYEPDPFDPVSYKLEMRWQWFEAVMQFDCWSPLHAESDRLADWFKTFMNLYTWVIKLYGISEVRYWQRRGDLVSQSFRDAMPRRSLQYYFRTVAVQPYRVRNLTQVHIQARVHPGYTPIVERDDVVTGGGPWADQWDKFHDDSGQWLGGTIDIEDTRDFVDSLVNP